MIEIVHAPAFATVQDGGRTGFRRSGVPPGGAMDSAALRMGNELVGNAPDAAAIEWALTGGALRFHADTTFALAGADAAARLDGNAVRHSAAIPAPAGATLTIERLTRGRFLYLCFAGGLDVPVVLGGRGTYLPAAFGGAGGRRLGHGDRLSLREPVAPPSPPERPPEDGANTLGAAAPIRLVAGPQAGVLSDRDWDALLRAELRVSPQSDRLGYRLTGFRPESAYTADTQSEPSCVGAVQLTPDGTLIVLMPDGPTVTGYPKIAVVRTADLPRVAQREVGAQLRFELARSDR